MLKWLTPLSYKRHSGGRRKPAWDDNYDISNTESTYRESRDGWFLILSWDGKRRDPGCDSFLHKRVSLLHWYRSVCELEVASMALLPKGSRNLTASTLLQCLRPHAPAGVLIPLSLSGLYPGTAERWSVSQVHPQKQRQHAQCRQPHAGTWAASERSVWGLQLRATSAALTAGCVPGLYAISDFLILLLG